MKKLYQLLEEFDKQNINKEKYDDSSKRVTEGCSGVTGSGVGVASDSLIKYSKVLDDIAFLNNSSVSILDSELVESDSGMVDKFNISELLPTEKDTENTDVTNANVADGDVVYDKIDNIDQQDINNLLPEKNEEKKTGEDYITKSEHDAELEGVRYHYENIIESLEVKLSIIKELKSKFDLIINQDIQNDIVPKITELSIAILQILVKKLNLILPVDFNKIFNQYIAVELDKIQEKRQVSICVNPVNYELFKEILNFSELNNKDSIVLSTDVSQEVGNIDVKCSSVSFRYNQHELTSAVENVIKQLITLI
ncbi:hypothetical protein [Rickettsia endosymbiont of Cardiosporidium cionae]|uniref:hypothetical protein n=1 Tax=Rickettsia endosymbiont of Cardiosporidium cionae TaxID=2777155 RepID=UPI001894C0CA|nr:hypothetical protein [Rickettsia endosymbiont of Cardiosporidium cionae]KAF8818693.1 hypothetical protein IHI24_000418 [Rickettsia endosymbiont of Cardiosporidium cionae]